MKVRINGIVWAVDTKREWAKAKIGRDTFRIRRSLCFLDPKKPFTVLINSIPASGATMEFYGTANEAAEYISSLSNVERAALVEYTEDMDALAEADAEQPRIRLTFPEGGEYV